MKRFLNAIKIFFVLVLVLAIAFVLLFYSSTQVTSNIDSFDYALPYSIGTKHRVIQGYGGIFSHIHAAAIDFEMPVGTPVCAARSGTIYSYKDDSNEGGPLPGFVDKANYIMIQHDDGSFGCYWHLQKNGVLIKSGHVTKGEQIGLSGATGESLIPHLHFSVKRRLTYERDSYVRTKFITTAGVVLLKKGRSYRRPKC